MKKLLLIIFILIMANEGYAQLYTGKAENITMNNNGIVFDVVVLDDNSKEVYRGQRFVNLMNVESDSIQKIIDRTTAEIWAHIEEAQKIIDNKTTLEKYTYTSGDYKGTIKLVGVNDRGVEFKIILKKNDVQIAEYNRWLSTGVQTATEVETILKKMADNAAITMDNKNIYEAYEKEVNSYIDSSLRP